MVFKCAKYLTKCIIMRLIRCLFFLPRVRRLIETHCVGLQSLGS